MYNRLGAMGLQWKGLPGKIQDKLEESLLMNGDKMSEVGLSCFMKGSVMMGYEWKKSERVKELIFGRIEQLYGGKGSQMGSERELSAIIYNMGEIGLKWKELSEEVQRSCFNGIEQCAHSCNSQEISNIIYG